MKNIYRISLVLHLSIFMTASVFGQDNYLINGTITGEQGKPVAEVSVSIEGDDSPPAITDSTGKFQLSSPGKDVWLLIVPLSDYKSKRIFLNSREELNIALTPNDIPSGYDLAGNLFNSELRRNIVSAATVPQLEKIFSYPSETIDQYLEGYTPGLWSTAQSGMPISGNSTFIRGIRSLYTSNQPLYIVDGQPMEDPGIFQSGISGYDYNPIASLDPMDITNITVLKDYLGAAIYGMKGSNGVVLIETLKPTEVRTTIDFSLRTGFSAQPEYIPQLNNLQYKSLANEVLMSSGQYEEDYQLKYAPLFATNDDPDYFRYNKNTNWQSEIFRNTIINDYYLRIKGGDEIARYGLSVGYLNHQGLVKETTANRFNVRFVGSFNVVKWLQIYISSNLVNSSANLRESALSPVTSPILSALFKAPILHPYQYDENGDELKVLEEVNSLGVSNPLAIVNSFQGAQTNLRLANSFRVNANIIENYLTWTSILGITFNSLNENVFMPNHGMELYARGEVYNEAKSMKNYLSTIYSDNYLNYRQEFNGIHAINAAAGLRLYKNSLEIDWGIGRNAHENDEYKQLQNGVSYLREMGGESADWNRFGVYSTAGYSYKNRYYLEANVITEYSTRLGKNATDLLYISGLPMGLFYSFGAAWRISEESFLKDASWIGDLKLRASYGKTGNDDIGNLSSINYYTVDHYRGTSGMVPGSYTDQSLKFESNYQLNTGIDFSLPGDRVFIYFNVYNTNTKDLLVFEPQPTYTGSALTPANNGEILNRGWDLEFWSRVISYNDFTWDIGINLSGIENKVLNIKDGAIVSPFQGGRYISKEGEAVLNFYGYKYEGVFATQQEANEAGLENESGVPFGAGDAKFEDISGPSGVPDSVINEFDFQLLGSPLPDYFGGFRNTFSYKRWTLSADLQFVSGREVFNYLRFQNEKMTDLSNQSSSVLSRWTYEGQVTEMPRALYNDPVGNTDFSSRWIEDGSYLRLKHLTLSYTIEKSVWFFRNLEILISASNLFTWSKYKGYDPEFSYSYYSMEMGIDYGMVPQTRKFMVGLKVGL